MAINSLRRDPLQQSLERFEDGVRIVPITQILYCVLFPLSDADDARRDGFRFVVGRIDDSALTVPLTRQPGCDRLAV